MGSRTEIFAGANLFLSRNLVPPELYDSIHDALRLNGAQVFLCCDPSRNSPNDYHAISSPDHEKFASLKAKGCNMLGPHCILSCAKERRSLPKQGYTCCLAMDGVKILASGFENDEKKRIAQLVIAMGGVLCSKASLDVSFVIVKNVLAAKYKWAINVLKKPAVSINWLNQCWLEHRLVPQEPYRIPPFSGLMISITRIPLGERREIEKLIIQNGGQYSGDLTKNCTHLVSDAPEGDKYFVAKRWGHIHIVTRRWVDLSVVRKACLEEEQYLVHASSVHLNGKQQLKERHSQDENLYSQCVQSDLFGDLETSTSQRTNSILSDGAKVDTIDETIKPHELPASGEAKVDTHVAEDSEDEDSDLYLSNCRILFLGFDEKELRKLISMIRRGGGSRHMSLNEKLTHIIVGMPSETEKKEVRRVAAWGIINVVKHIWLEDCDNAKKEVPILQRHIASDYLVGKESVCIGKALSINSAEVEMKSFGAIGQPINKRTDGSAFEKLGSRGFTEVILQESSDSMVKSKANDHLLDNRYEGKSSVKLSSNLKKATGSGTSFNIFKGYRFCFSSSFPEERKGDIVEWVRMGGGLLVDDYVGARFIIECHGVRQKHAFSSDCVVVSAHWIRSCLLEGSLQDVSSHVLYSPLQCRVPLPGFESLRFCISQYETRERQLLRNLCFTLGSECKEKLTRKVTHLLCKFSSGQKYDKACEWGIESVTAEWIFECIKMDKLASMDSYRPRTFTVKDREAGVSFLSQYPTQDGHLYSDFPSQMPTMLDKSMSDLKSSDASLQPMRHQIGDKDDLPSERPESSRVFNKKIRSSENTCMDIASGSPQTENLDLSAMIVPDVASAIEDLLAQSSKIKDLKLPGENGCSKSTFSSDGFDSRANSSLPRASNSWSNRSLQSSSVCNPPTIDSTAKPFDAFSETQTDSQVVGYEEDLSGRQKIIDRVRSQGSMLTPDKQKDHCF